MKVFLCCWERAHQVLLLRSRVIGFSLALALSACSATQEVNPPGERHFAWRMFTRGEAELACLVSCSYRYGSNRPELKKLYAGGRWQLLAERVLYIGHKGDQSWFYLGRAAEELGFPEAALSYYTKANNERYKCGGVLNTCDGFVFPRDIDNRVAIIQQQKTAALERQQMAAEKQAKRTSTSRADKVKATAQPRKPTTAQTKKSDKPKQASQMEKRAQTAPAAPTEKAPVGSLIDM